MLYDIFIYPIEIVLKFIFETCYNYTDSYIMATILLSLVVSTVLLPFYYWAEKLQNKEREISQRLKPTIDEFKSVYSGSKLHAVISTLYRQNNYHPIYSLRSVMGLLVQVPFFIAAYHFLSTYQPIVGVETWLFKDLGAPDGWIHLGNLHINVMPFIMTIVNLLSAFIFTRGLTKNEEIQTWVLALLFLVLLYTSPVLLVFYWTMNNIFSLLKNIIEKKVKSKINLSEVESEFNYFSKTYTTLKNLIKKLFENISIVEIFFVLILLYIYLIGLIYNVPEGITNTFAIEFKTFLNTIFVLVLLIITFSSTLWNSIKSYRLHKFEKYKKSDFLLILLPLTPIVQYVFLNQEALTIYGSLYVIAVAIIVSLLIVITIPTLLSIFASRLILLTLGLSLSVLVFYMPSLALNFSWHEEGSRKIQWSILLIIFVISYILYIKKEKLLKMLIVVFFIVNSLVSVSNISSKKDDLDIGIEKNNPLPANILKMKVFEKPNIYLLIYDAYVGKETMFQYGIDNRKQEKFLTDNEFKIYKDTYSIAADSKLTMNRVLNMSSSYLESAIAGNGNVYKFLKSQGYTVGIVMEDRYFYQTKIPKLDFYYPVDVPNGHVIILSSIFEGEFRFDAAKSYSKVSSNDYIEEKRKYMQLMDDPRFIYTHVQLPGHSQNSGKCLVDEIDLFRKRLNEANEQMIGDVNKIIKNDPNSIIIVAGDHGPYLTGNCTGLSKNGFLPKDKITRLHIQDRFGTFLAIRWPKSYKVYDKNITVLQDIFPAIFATLLKDKSILEKLKINPVTDGGSTSRVKVKNGIIMDGVNKGEPLFLDK